MLGWTAGSKGRRRRDGFRGYRTNPGEITVVETQVAAVWAVRRGWILDLLEM